MKEHYRTGGLYTLRYYPPGSLGIYSNNEFEIGKCAFLVPSKDCLKACFLYLQYVPATAFNWAHHLVIYKDTVCQIDGNLFLTEIKEEEEEI